MLLVHILVGPALTFDTSMVLSQTPFLVYMSELVNKRRPEGGADTVALLQLRCCSHYSYLSCESCEVETLHNPQLQGGSRLRPLAVPAHAYTLEVLAPLGECLSVSVSAPWFFLLNSNRPKKSIAIDFFFPSASVDSEVKSKEGTKGDKGTK